jgi:hypothetical protein
MRTHRAARAVAGLALFLPLLAAGCFGGMRGGGPLGPGSEAPDLLAQEWVNEPGPEAGDLAGRVVVIDVFATW